LQAHIVKLYVVMNALLIIVNTLIKYIIFILLILFILFKDIVTASVLLK